jgi:hypothetical protein
MAEEVLDLWPPIDTAGIRAPVIILKQQAALLGKHTKNLLEGRVDTILHQDGLLHRFSIYAPTLNYVVELLNVSHGPDPYPVHVQSVRGLPNARFAPLNSEEEFIDWLKTALSSPETKRILAVLLAQVES